MATIAANPNTKSDQAFFLEAHYYSGGLRTKPLGSDSGRPAWAAPADWVGFRDEFSLERDDTVVEFARFLVDGSHVTWLGIYKKSVDHVHGDRQNHAGLGVWLHERRIVDPDSLLQGLLKFLDIVHPDKLDFLEAAARSFMAEEYLPRYVAANSPLPDELSGSPYSQTPLPDTKLLVATADESRQAWRDVAEQIIRMTLFQDDSRHSRATILVPDPARRIRPPDERAAPLQGRLLVDLAIKIPTAFEATSGALATQSLELKAAQEESSELRNQLKNAQIEGEALRTRAASLEQDIAQNDTLSALLAIKNALSQVDRRNTDILEGITLLQRSAASRTGGRSSFDLNPGGDHAEGRAPAAGKPTYGQTPGVPPKRRFRWSSGYTLMAIGLLVAIGVAGLLYLKRELLF